MFFNDSCLRGGTFFSIVSNLQLVLLFSETSYVILKNFYIYKTISAPDKNVELFFSFFFNFEL